MLQKGCWGAAEAVQRCCRGSTVQRFRGLKVLRFKWTAGVDIMEVEVLIC